MKDRLLYFLGIVVLVFQVGLNTTFGQCPESSNFFYDYITINKGSKIADWNDPTIWRSAFWVKPTNPPCFGKINRSIAVNSTVVLHNKGFSIEFNQPTKVCGSLAVEGKLIISGGCSPLNVHGKLIVYGDLETNQSIFVWPGGEVIVFGNWIVKGGANPIVMGKVIVKGNVDSKFGINVALGAEFMTFGDFSSKNGLGLINGDYIVNGNINIPSWSFKLGIGDIYCFGVGSKIVGYKYLNKFDLRKNLGLYSEFIKYQRLFWPVPSKYIDLKLICGDYLQEYMVGGCVIDSTVKYKSSNRNRIYLDSKAKEKSILLKMNVADKSSLKFIFDDSLQVEKVYYCLNGVNRNLDGLFYDKGDRLLTVYLEGKIINDLKIRGLQGVRKISGQGFELDDINKDEVRDLSIYSITDLNKPIFMILGSVSWNGKDQAGRGLESGVYLLKVTFKNGTSISGQFLIK